MVEGVKKDETSDEVLALESVISLEEESEKVALEKLQKLFDHCDQFAVRFMNIEEYEIILRKQGVILGNAEVNYRSKTNLDFEDWLDLHCGSKYKTEDEKRYWARGAVANSNWEWGAGNLLIAEELLDKFREFRAERGNRAEAVRKFREYVVSTASKTRYLKMQGVFRLADLLSVAKAYPQVDDVSVQTYGEDRLQIVHNFLVNDLFLDTPDNFRKLFNALTTSRSSVMSDDDYRQYHVAMIFGINAVGKYTPDAKDPGKTENSNGWGIVQGEQAKNILGAICCMPQKEMFNEMISLSRVAGATAHPVFDNAGNVRWPKKQVIAE